MQRERLELALERLQPNQWRRFEEFASAFLVSDFPTLRSVAQASGDGGRDSELFSPDGYPKTVLQYSVSSDFKAKIRRTAERVKETIPDARLLVYVTNHQVGALADALKNDILQKHDLVLDVFDRAWFLDRFEGDSHRETVAENLSADIVDRYLASRGVIESRGLALSSAEYRAALLYLQLQWQDDTRAKGLTKLSFDALVRAVLQETDSDNRMTRVGVKDAIRLVVQAQEEQRVDALVDSALARLTKKYIRHWTKDDTFCLTYEESQRIAERMVEIEAAEIRAVKDIERIVAHEAAADYQESDFAELSRVIREIIEHYFWERGEVFASAVAGGRMESLELDDLEVIIQRVLSVNPPSSRVAKAKMTLLPHIVERILFEPTDALQRMLRSLADSYTLLAFLRETPDVQDAIKKMFSVGTVWLDTTLILPVFVEELFAENRRRFTHLLRSAHQAGLKLRVTPGVLEEVERHMNRCMAFVHIPASEWRGRVPFLVKAYMETGRSEASFGSWLENFRGELRPEEDIADYLREVHSVRTESLKTSMEQADSELRLAVQEIWRTVHDRRRSKTGAEADEISIGRLVRHDVENYVGVLERRQREEKAPLGYSSWWITLDGTAYRVEEKLRKKWGLRIKGSPVMSPDFLLNYLAVGPSRQRLSRSADFDLPLSVGYGLVDYIGTDLLVAAEKIRAESSDLPEHIIRRRVRDHLDAAKRRIGRVARRGVDLLGEDIYDIDYERED